jgi:hypothetical protein
VVLLKFHLEAGPCALARQVPQGPPSPGPSHLYKLVLHFGSFFAQTIRTRGTLNSFSKRSGHQDSLIYTQFSRTHVSFSFPLRGVVYLSSGCLIVCQQPDVDNT